MGFLQIQRLKEILDKNNFKPDAFIESGTYIGRTILPVAKELKDVKCYTIEIVKEISDHTKKKSEEQSLNNIEFIIGDTMVELPKIIEGIEDDNIVIFLDAHSSDYCSNNLDTIMEDTNNQRREKKYIEDPIFSTNTKVNKLTDVTVPLLEELTIISKFNKNFIVIIDDFDRFGVKSDFDDWTDINTSSCINIFKNKKFEIDSFKKPSQLVFNIKKNNESLLNDIKLSKLNSEPFDHYTCKLFNEDLNKKLINNFIEIENKMVPMKNNPGRFIIKLNGNIKSGIDFSPFPFLKNIEPLNSVLLEYQNSFFKDLIDLHKFEMKDYNYYIDLLIDKISYKIGPHTDSNKRLLTTITYIVTEEDKNKNLGVSLYKDTSNRNENNWDSSTHHEFDENFVKVSQLEYSPGTTVHFVVTPNSFHAVEELTENCQRMSIQTKILK